jgi:hypothetical protein
MKRVINWFKQLTLWNMNRDKVDPILARIKVRSISDKRMMNKCRRILEYVGYAGSRSIFTKPHAQPNKLLLLDGFGRQSVRMMGVILGETGEYPTVEWARAASWAVVEKHPSTSNDEKTQDAMSNDASISSKDLPTDTLFIDASLSNSPDGGKKYE